MKKGILGILFLIGSLGLKAQDQVLPNKDSLLNGQAGPLDSLVPFGKIHKGTAGACSSKADGTKTANGEIFSNHEFTAAINLFPLNTWVLVTNTKNKLTVLVRINDRTSKKKKAPIMEISRAGVSALGFLKTGSTSIKVQQIRLTKRLSIDSTINTLLKTDSLPDTSILDSTKITLTKTGKTLVGIASFYSKNLDGTKTSTGERYRNNKFTAASNNFKLNTWVRVTNLSNQKTVVVRINDRMHPRMAKKGRVVDLSRVAAKQLDFMEKGLTKVKVEVINLSTESPVKPAQTDSTGAKTDSIGKLSRSASLRINKKSWDFVTDFYNSGFSMNFSTRFPPFFKETKS